MRITAIELQCEDIMWFGIDNNNHIFECTSSGCGNVPEFVCISKENTESLLNFFMNELAEFTEETSSQYVGIGVYLTNDKTTNTILVVGIMNGSPALDAGMQAGDIIKKVNDVTYTGETMDDAIKVLKGEEKASEQNFETITEPGFYVNNKVAENLGITVPDDLANNAVESFDEITAE